MKAAVLRGAPGTLELADVTVDAPAAFEVLVRTAAVGVCHSDLHFADGSFPTKFPVVLGHEGSGIVESVGAGVTHVRPGDAVIVSVSAFCGTCEYCLSGRPALCGKEGLRRPRDAPPRLVLDGAPVHQLQGVSAFAEEMLVHENALVRIPQDVPLHLAALLGCAVTTGLGAVFRTAQVEPGSTVVVVGCGGIGLNCIQGARLAGATRIVAVDMAPAKLELAARFGATDVVLGGDTAVEEVRELTAGGVDYAFEAIGNRVTVGQAWAMLRPGGAVTVIGMMPFGTTIEVPGHELLQEKRLLGCLMGSNQFRTDLPKYLDLHRQGRLMLDELVGSTVTLDEVNGALDRLSDGSAARTIITFPR